MQKKVNLAILHCIKNKVLMQSARNPKYIFKKRKKEKKKNTNLYYAMLRLLVSLQMSN